MSTKHVRTAADLVRFKCALKVTCGRCGNALTLGGMDVARQIGNLELSRLQPRLKCSLCGAHDGRMTVISPPPRR